MYCVVQIHHETYPLKTNFDNIDKIIMAIHSFEGFYIADNFIYHFFVNAICVTRIQSIPSAFENLIYFIKLCSSTVIFIDYR